MRKFLMTAAFAGTMLATAAGADPIVDGTRDAAYGAADAHVSYSATAPNSNFGTPTAFSDTTSYDIYLTSGANRVFGYFQAAGDGGTAASSLSFANLYFGLNGGGSNLGFELGTVGGVATVNAFVPGVDGKVAINSNLFSIATSTALKGANAYGFEFSLDNSLFTQPITGLNQTGQVFPTTGSNIRLNLSQAFGYSVAGGQAAYGNNRLGVTTIGGETAGAVPEPATWAMMIVGFAVAGASLRRRAKVRVAFA